MSQVFCAEVHAFVVRGGPTDKSSDAFAAADGIVGDDGPRMRALVLMKPFVVQDGREGGTGALKQNPARRHSRLRPVGTAPTEHAAAVTPIEKRRTAARTVLAELTADVLLRVSMLRVFEDLLRVSEFDEITRPAAFGRVDV